MPKISNEVAIANATPTPPPKVDNSAIPILSPFSNDDDAESLTEILLAPLTVTSPRDADPDSDKLVSL